MTRYSGVSRNHRNHLIDSRELFGREICVVLERGEFSLKNKVFVPRERPALTKIGEEMLLDPDALTRGLLGISLLGELVDV